MIKRLLQNDWFVTLLFLAAYLCTNSYIYAWDDQHLEIPLLKHLIDPTLYKGDYYVEGLAANFSSYLYPLLAKCITIAQIPAVYFVLFLVSRYMMFYWAFRLWQLISGERFAAAMAVLMFFLMGRTEEFLYRTFSHQEFSYIFMFGGFYYFYRERFLLAAALLGIGANFHAIYNLFPMLYMLTFLFFTRKDRWAVILKTGLTFTLFALPFLLWQIPHSLGRGAATPVPVSEWMPLYLLACPQNFFFWETPLAEALKSLPFVLVHLEPYLFLLALYVFLWFVEPRLRRDRKTLALAGVGYFLIFLSFVFSYIHPSRFVLDLNLVRNEQFVRFMLMGYATLFACRVAKEGRPWQAALAGAFFLLVGLGGTEFLLLKIQKYMYVFALIAGVFVLLQLKPQWAGLRKTIIVLPLAASFVSFAIYHYSYLQAKEHGTGFWQITRNWTDMQNYVRLHTSKDALILTPYDTETGGFRIRSERKVLVCYRDCGIIGFDYQAAVEWHKRIKDIENFRVMMDKNFEGSLLRAILKYKVDYIVFMNYYQPKEQVGLLRKIYQNEVFALYEVHH